MSSPNQNRTVDDHDKPQLYQQVAGSQKRSDYSLVPTERNSAMQRYMTIQLSEGKVQP